MRLAVLLLVASLVLGGSATALDVPPLTGRLVDLAHLLPEDLARSLSQELAAHERRTGNQVALLTLPSLVGEPLEEFSHKVATTWKLGQKGTDNGVLLLVVPGDRRVRIEVGYGLEGVLTDAKSSRIIRNEMVPWFKAGDYARGIAAGLHAILGTVEGTYTAPEQPVGPMRRGGGDLFAVWVGAFLGALLGASGMRHGLLSGGLLSFLIALAAGVLLACVAAAGAVIGALVLSALFRGGCSGPAHVGRWPGGFGGGFAGSGSFGGGGFGGGGGGFGGGGASGSW